MKPRVLSFLVSLFVTLIVFCVSAYFLTGWKNPLIISGVTFISTFVFFIVAIEIYIARRISLVYKLISTLKIDKELKQALGNNISDDPLNQIEEEVREWARVKALEIETLQKIANYRKEFLGNLSHELKTPLFNIQGYVQSLIDGGMDDKEIASSFLQKAEKNIDRLCALVADVDVMSKLDTGEMPLNLSAFDIMALMKEIAFTLDENAKTKNIKFEFASGDRRMVEADKEKIAQVVTNLFDNSIKYGKQGGTTTIKCYTMDKQVLIEVTDNGVGIDEEHLPRLFERFYRVDKSRKSQDGTGIGLAIVKHILNAHKQTINVRSARNVGTTFAFTLAAK
jgi:two-component system phosphate regulon sensor histidine kinase PhoR